MNTKTDNSQAAVGIGSTALLGRINKWVTGIGWTDLGTAWALVVVGGHAIDAKDGWTGLWCFVLSVIVYCRAPRAKPNVKVRDRSGSGTPPQNQTP